MLVNVTATDRAVVTSTLTHVVPVSSGVASLLQIRCTQCVYPEERPSKRPAVIVERVQPRRKMFQLRGARMELPSARRDELPVNLQAVRAAVF